MGINKVIYGTTVLVDLTGDTVTESTLASGITAHDKSGNQVTGTMQVGGSNLFKYGGANAEKVAEYDEQFTLDDTSFVIGTTSSTSSTTIKASVSNQFTSSSIDIGDKDVVVLQTVTVTPVHDSSVTTAFVKKYAIVHITHIAKGRNGTYTNDSITTRRSTTMSYPFIHYVNTKGVDTLANTSYGFYATPASATVSTTVKASSPTLYCRANASYESQANMKLVTECTWDWHLEVYLVDAKTSISSAIQETGYELLLG